MVDIDIVAKSDVINKWCMPDSLHLPIAARTKESIVKYIGTIVAELSAPNTNNAFLVEVPKPTSINTKLAVWKLPVSKILHQELQVWVHVDYKRYRPAYKKAFPDENISSPLLILDHIQNRKMLKVMGFNYTRLIPISKGANSSSGSASEQWGIEYHSTPKMRKINSEKNSFIQYADLSSLVKMLNMKTGGGVMDAVNEAQKLLLEV